MPTEYPTPTNTNKKSTTQTIGILLIVFASMYLFYSLYAIGAALLASAFVDALPALKKIIPEFKNADVEVQIFVQPIKTLYHIQALEKVATMVISAYGLFAGIRLVQLQQKKSGILHSIRWAYTALVYLLLELVIFLLVQQPLVRRLFQTISEKITPLVEDGAAGTEFLSGLANNSGMGSEIAGLLFLAAFPIVTILLLHRAEK
ncbi:MAG TPA: hypothetical protein PLY93_11195 [Turneriella sp.]|nr:hypothetical protein [Turneriella sp.]